MKLSFPDSLDGATFYLCFSSMTLVLYGQSESATLQHVCIQQSSSRSQRGKKPPGIIWKDFVNFLGGLTWSSALAKGSRAAAHHEGLCYFAEFNAVAMKVLFVLPLCHRFFELPQFIVKGMQTRAHIASRIQRWELLKCHNWHPLLPSKKYIYNILMKFQPKQRIFSERNDGE